jgi:predicted CXXCH cytochrome family protein
MTKFQLLKHRNALLAFMAFFLLSLAIGGAAALVVPGSAAPQGQAELPTPVPGGFAGSETCLECHENIHSAWKDTFHANAFTSPIFQRDWTELGSDTTCLECHTTGYDPATGTYSEAGVSCEACHGPMTKGHPASPMPVQPNADLCAKCHKTTTDEWRSSKHSEVGIQCQDCHNAHSQTRKADTVTALCTNCHKERGDTFAHGTHANAGLECSNCHMYSDPREGDPIMGLVPTGHTFSVGSDACIGCHQDTVHTRDSIVKLSGEVASLQNADVGTLEQQKAALEDEVTNLKARSTVRLYTGLTQGAIVGLIMGGTAAWIISRRMKVVEVEDNG